MSSAKNKKMDVGAFMSTGIVFLLLQIPVYNGIAYLGGFYSFPFFIATLIVTCLGIGCYFLWLFVQTKNL